MSIRPGIRCVLLVLMLLSMSQSNAALANSDASKPPQLDTVVVEGSMPGLGLWEVRKGDHSLWLLGYLTPLPTKMEWRAEQTQAVLDQAAVVLQQPSLVVGADIGFFSSLSMLPKALRMRRNPDHQKLEDILPAETYAQWTHLKAQYLGDHRKIESWRPIFAAERLLNTAIRRNDLEQDNRVNQAVMDWAKQRKIKQVSTAYKVKIGDPKQLLRDYSDTRLDDVACFKTTLDWLERDLELMRQRANAWAIGDIEKLAGLLVEDPRSSCMEAFSNSELFRSRGIEDMEQHVADTWLKAADAALAEHRVSFGILSMSELIGSESHRYLDALRKRGYEVIAPE